MQGDENQEIETFGFANTSNFKFEKERCYFKIVRIVNDGKLRKSIK